MRLPARLAWPPVVAAALVVKELGPRGRTRRRVAAQHLHGSGIEIGALHQPLRTSAEVKYVDRLSRAGLRAQYPELRALPLVEPDIIDDGESLRLIGEGTQDFIIANHFIEHCEDPIGTLGTFVSRLRPGGRLYMAVPDKRYTFDRNRPSTTLDHLLADSRDAGAGSRWDHYVEFARMVSLSGKGSEAAVRAQAETMAKTGFSIHFHVWTTAEFTQFVEWVCTDHLPDLQIADVVRNGEESIFVLQHA